MRSISSREEASQFYKQINDLIDTYIDTHKVKPSEVHRYINKNYESFLEESGLSDVKGIRIVISDVLDHRKNMQSDKVMKFESFINESVLDINKANIEHEKVLADFYNTSLGHVKLKDSNIHLYEINDFGNKSFAIIYSNKEIEILTKNIVDSLKNDFNKKSITITKIDGISIDEELKFSFSDLYDEEKLRKSCYNILDKDKLMKIIFSLIGQNSNKDIVNKKIKYEDKFDGYHIWEIK